MKNVIEIIDNKKFIINAIKKQAEKCVLEMTDSYKEEVKLISKEKKSIFDKQKEKILFLHKKDIESTEKQLLSNFDLEEKQSELMMQKIVNEKVISAVHTILKDDASALNKLFFSLADKLESLADKKIILFKTPKGVKLSGKKCDDCYEDFRISAIMNDIESIELSLDELLHENEVEINKIILDELFK